MLGALLVLRVIDGAAVGFAVAVGADCPVCRVMREATWSVRAVLGSAEGNSVDRGAVTAPVREAGEAFGRSSKHPMVYVSDTTGALQKRLAAGERMGTRLAVLPQVADSACAARAAGPATRPAPRRSASIIQLRDATPARVVSDDAGNVIERRLVRTDVIRRRGDSIADLLDYWTALKGDDRVPAFADIDPVRLAQLGLLGRLHVLNAENADPAQMRFDLYGNKIDLIQPKSGGQN